MTGGGEAEGRVDMVEIEGRDEGRVVGVQRLQDVGADGDELGGGDLGAAAFLPGGVPDEGEEASAVGDGVDGVVAPALPERVVGLVVRLSARVDVGLNELPGRDAG